MLSDGTTTLTWDRAGRMLSTQGSGVQVNYLYNGLGQRIQHTGGATGNLISKHLVDILGGSLSDSISVTTNGVATLYVHGPMSLTRQMDSGGAWTWLLPDGLGSVRGVVNANNMPVDARQFTPYGEPIALMGNTASLYGFTGEQTDPNGLVHLRARNYLPELGVFPSLDMVMGTNRYGYVDGDPVNRVDPSGNVMMDMPKAGIVDPVPVPSIIKLVIKAVTTAVQWLIATTHPATGRQPMTSDPNAGRQPAASGPGGTQYVSDPGQQLVGGSQKYDITSDGPSKGSHKSILVSLFDIDDDKIENIKPYCDPNCVIRAGLPTVNNLRSGYAYNKKYDVWGMSVDYGATFMELAKEGHHPNGQLSYASYDEVVNASSFYTITLTATPTSNTYHRTLAVFRHAENLQELPEGLAKTLVETVFVHHVKNPYQNVIKKGKK